MDPNSIFACFRPNVLKMEGYTPGEQWQDPQVIKLNTNENPYPPPVGVQKVLETYPLDRLRRYPDPLANRLRDYVAKLWGLPNREWVLVGNGSDDILTLLFRCFADETRKVVVLNPSYSLYPVLAQIQNAEVNEIILTYEFELPDEFPDEVWKANLWMITRPNAPTGNSFPKRRIEQICEQFSGIVAIDEAYVDFAEDHCLDFLERYPRVVIIRTMSKSYALAHARIGFACAHPFIIEGMIKVKDSYNVNGLSQMIALAALEDQEWLRNTVKEICQNREFLATALQSLGFKVIPSQTNFIFTQPPFNARRYYELLRTKKILIRYFPGPYTGDFVRITIGRQEEMKTLIQVTQEIIRNYQE